MKIILFSFFYLAVTFTYGQSFDRDNMDSLFTWIDKNDQGMGSLSIFQDGTEVFQRAIGFSSLELQRKANAHTVYGIGSISKTFTATIILLLIEEGKLQLDSKLSEYFPEIPNAVRISIEHLLRHQSGLFNFTDEPDYKNWMLEPMSDMKLIQKIVSHKTEFEPGTKYSYSNTNYVLLALIAEKIEDDSFGKILTQRITDPLNLKGTYFNENPVGSIDEAASYWKSNLWISATKTNRNISKGAGGIFSTPKDLNIFLHALFSGNILNKESLKKMMNIEMKYGLGLMRVPFYNKFAYGHNGGIDGFQSNAFFFPEENIAITYLSNGVDMPLNDILIGALSIYFDKPYNFPSFKEPYSPSKNDLKSYEGLYSNARFPLKIEIKKVGRTLTAQATGQSALTLDPVDKHEFKFDPAGIIIKFDPEQGKLTLSQGGLINVLIKE